MFRIVSQPGARSRAQRVAIAGAAGVFTIFLLWLRAPDGFRSPQFWAEDATVFWLQQYLYGWHAVFIPYAGYLHLAPRAVALLASACSPEYAPRLYALAAALLTAWTAATIAAAIQPAWMGFLFGCALVLPQLPTGEIFMNITNIQWILAPGLAAVVMSRSSEMPILRRNGLVFAAVSSFTGPFSVMLAPLSAIRLWKTRDAVSIVALAGALTQFAMLLFLRTAAAATQQSDYAHLAWTVMLRAFPPDMWTVLATAVLFAVACIVASGRRLRLGLIMLAALVLAGTIVNFAGQPFAFDGIGNGPRYFYVPALVGYWCAISLLFTRKGALVGMAWLLLMCATYPRGAFRRPALIDQHWSSYAGSIGNHEVVVPINPPGWKLDIPAKK